MESTQIFPEPIPAIYVKPVTVKRIRKPKAPKEVKKPIDIQNGMFFVRFD